MDDCCKSSNEPSGSIKCGEILDYLRTCKLLKQESAPWSYLVNKSRCRKYITGILRRKQAGGYNCKTVCEYLNCICITPDNFQWQTVTNMVKTFRFSKETVIFFSLFIGPRKKGFTVLCYFYNDLTSCTYIYAHELTLVVYVPSGLKI